MRCAKRGTARRYISYSQKVSHWWVRGHTCLSDLRHTSLEELCCAEAHAKLAQPFGIRDGGAIGAQVQFSLQVQRQQFRALGFNHRDILLDNLVLKAAYLLVAEIPVVHSHVHPDDRSALRGGGDGKDHSELRIAG